MTQRNTIGEDFTEEVVYNTIKQMKPLEALGSDGMPALFYQKNWDTGKWCFYNDPRGFQQVSKYFDLIITKNIVNRLKLILPSIVG